jgi:hypothetical protein
MKTAKWKSWDLINFIAGEMGYGSYLEIGVGKGRNFARIGIPDRVGVDPNRDTTYRMASDDFFARNRRSFDVIFIDGLHHAIQAMRDISNALAALNPKGAIVVHDCNPQMKEHQVVPRNCDVWTGDVWKAWVILRATRADLNMVAIDMCRQRCGCGVIRRGSQVPLPVDALDSLTWGSLTANREQWLNLCTPEEFREGFPNAIGLKRQSLEADNAK